jgi:predicted transcriptional regulator of viral defense system
VEIHQLAPAIYAAGVTTINVSGTAVRVYSPEKTLADCFRFRNHIGMDVVLEALRTYRSRRGANLQRVLEYARICRAETGMRPYLEAST